MIFNYYLVALNMDEDVMKPRVINIDLDVEDEKELTNIAFIDELTSRYSEKQFRNHLIKNNILSNPNTPVFIVRRSTSQSKVTDGNGNEKNKITIKYYSPIFKSTYSEFIPNLAISTLRKRNLNLEDSLYLLRTFCSLYKSNRNFREIANFILNSHDIKHLLDYAKSSTDKKINPIKYELLRDVVSALCEYDQCKDFEEFYSKVYRRQEFTNKILGILPKNYPREKLDKPVRESLEYVQELKRGKWDDPVAQAKINKDFKESNTFDIDHLHLTLEDRLRAGLISDYSNYLDQKEKLELEYRRSSKR